MQKTTADSFPPTSPRLKPYFDSPIYDGILERYTILPASSLVSELRPGGDWVITQKAPVNEEQDWRTATSLTGTKQATLYATNRWVLLHSRNAQRQNIVNSETRWWPAK